MHALLFSSSKVAGYEKRFGYAEEKISEFLSDVHEVIFVPYALQNHDAYTDLVKETFLSRGVSLRSVHEFKNPLEAMENAECIFIGGGNTFLLLDWLYKTGLLEVIKKKVHTGTKHMGETREDRIREFHEQNTRPVVGLREGAFLEIKNNHITLGGIHGAKLFQPGEKAKELTSEDNLDFLLSL